MPAIEVIPRILFVDNQVSDFLHYRMVLARKLQEDGFDVHVAVPREPGLEEISRQGIVVHTFYLQRKSTRLLDELRCWVSLLRLYRQLRPTLVHHICLKPALYGGVAARIAGVPAAGTPSLDWDIFSRQHHENAPPAVDRSGRASILLSAPKPSRHIPESVRLRLPDSQGPTSCQATAQCSSRGPA